ncbi:MAG TPA: 30S ribosomal protein S14 [Planctomycetota bacterium]|nr:30S ribosomal protein S14 [Planctomycetota bacterium]
MAKKSKVARNQQRLELAAKYRERRGALRDRSKDLKLSLEERMEARAALALLPRESSPTRYRVRCSITGRSRGNYRKFGVCRNVLRRLAHKGELPGCTKSSW